MEKFLQTVAIASITTNVWARSETKTFVAADESRVKSCAKAKSEAQWWVKSKLGHIDYAPPSWKPTKSEYSSCDCGASKEEGTMDCSIDATLSDE